MFPVTVTGAPLPVDSDAKTNAAGPCDEGVWRVPEETPIALVYNRRNYAVMLATPQDVIDFAVGFSLAERVIDHPGDIQGLDIHYTDRGCDLRLRIAERFVERLDVRHRRRTMPGNVGCGLCGLENADELFEILPPVAPTKIELDREIVAKAFDGLADHQPLNERTRTVHGAAWATLDGDITLVREDVGRHNALDKLLGALALSGADMQAGFVVMSSRCSYELVQKAASQRVRAIACLSAPTTFALRKAEEANMAIYARGRLGPLLVSL